MQCYTLRGYTEPCYKGTHMRLTEIMARRVCHLIYVFILDVINASCSNFNAGLTQWSLGNLNEIINM